MTNSTIVTTNPTTNTTGANPMNTYTFSIDAVPFTVDYDSYEEAYAYSSCEQGFDQAFGEEYPEGTFMQAHLTTNKENLTMNTINMQDINASALVSTMAAELFHYNLTPIVSMQVATSFVDAAIDYMDDEEQFADEFGDNLLRSQATIRKDNKVLAMEKKDIDVVAVMNALLEAKYITEEDTIGERFIYLCSLRQEAYAPTTEAIERRFNYTDCKQDSALFREAIHALEATEYTVDEHILNVAREVNAALIELNGKHEDAEGYVVSGCEKMDKDLGYKSEFKGDRRGRMYQAACHGPNGQSSDRSRALMDLFGVPTDYDNAIVSKHIMAEIHDMVAGGVDSIKKGAKAIKDMGEVAFVVACLEDEIEYVKKPWSFIKACRIMRELKAGNKPYIGMAVGLDAKCSGPQLGALMVGDRDIAAACGFKSVDDKLDAYKLGSLSLVAAGVGVGELSRNGIKKSYMGIFYGQGWAAFQNVAQLCKDEQFELVGFLIGSVEKAIALQTAYQTNPVKARALVLEDAASANPEFNVTEAVARKFHGAISKSFGGKMSMVRRAIKDYGSFLQGRVLHSMPDGYRVEMNYKVKVNALNEVMSFDTPLYDIEVGAYKFMNFQLKTQATNTEDFARTGFVNMIQATDALMARLIVAKLNRLGAKHIISVHDCFRVNVTEMHLLEQAIQWAYQVLFGMGTNEKSKDFPMGLDILGMYFQAANNMTADDGHKVMNQDQFRATTGKRRMPKFEGMYLSEMIATLGQKNGAFYFAK